jgi:glycosyltransferase involved in cell wall biosynthesis
VVNKIMKVAVITPYYSEGRYLLKRCIDSVAKQTYTNITHILVSDGFPSDYVLNHPDVKSGKIWHFKIPNCGDYGDTPRAIGSAVASANGFDAICFLDADCWYEADHIEQALSKVTDQTPIVTTARKLRDLQGEFIADDLESDGISFCDTNCYLIARPAFQFIGVWTFKERKYGIIGDRIFWANLPKQHIARSEKPTLNYMTKFAVHYLGYGKIPPPEAIQFVNGPDGLPVAEKYYK